MSIKKSNQFLNEWDKFILLAHNGPWNLNADACSKNEDVMLDYKSDVVRHKDLVRVLTQDAEDNDVMES